MQVVGWPCSLDISKKDVDMVRATKLLCLCELKIAVKAEQEMVFIALLRAAVHVVQLA